MQASSILKLARIDKWARQLAPGALTLFLLVIGLLPWGLSTHAMLPSLALMSVFYWSVRLPALCAPSFALFTGALADLTELTPFGTQALIFLLVQLLLRTRRRRFDSVPFFQLWLAYAAVVTIGTFFLWMIEAMFAEALLPVLPLIAKMLLAAALFPLMVKICFMPVERFTRGGEP